MKIDNTGPTQGEISKRRPTRDILKKTQDRQPRGELEREPQLGHKFAGARPPRKGHERVAGEITTNKFSRKYSGK